MASDRHARGRRIRDRIAESDSVAIAAAAVALMLGLAAGVSSGAGRMLERTSPHAAATPDDPTRRTGAIGGVKGVDDASDHDGGRPADLRSAADAGPLPTTGAAAHRTETGEAKVDPLEEPAVARAAEAGLMRMRVQFAQTLQPSVAGETGFDGLAAAMFGRVGAKPTPAGAPAPTVVSPAATAGSPGAAGGSAESPMRPVDDGARPAAGAEPADPRAIRDPREPRAPRTVRDAREGAALPAEPPLKRSIVLPAPERSFRAVPAEGSVTLVGEATVLIRSHGLTVLTDPNLLRRGEAARMMPGWSVARRADPALDVDELPPIDLVVLSRLREDHFDRISRRRLPRDVPIVAPASARAALVGMGFSSVHALPDWGTVRVGRGDAWLQLTATPTRASPRVLGALLPDSMGTLLEFGRDDGPAAYRIWISGDTAVDASLEAELAPRLGDVDLALLHVGGGPVLGLGGSMDDAGAARALRALPVRTAIPMRLDDFTRGSAAPLRALADFTRTANRSAGPQQAPVVRLLSRGDVHRFAPLQHWALASDDAGTVR